MGGAEAKVAVKVCVVFTETTACVTLWIACYGIQVLGRLAARAGTEKGQVGVNDSV